MSNIASSQGPCNQDSNFHVIIDVPDNVATLLENPETKYSFTLMDTISPLLVVGNRRLRGKFTSFSGTSLAFQPSSSSKYAGYVASSTKYLVFSDEI